MGDGEGKVDAELGLTRIAEGIIEKGSASLSHFWDINSLFNQFFDGHLAVPDTNFAAEAYLVKLIPTRQDLNPGTTILPTFSLDDAGNLMLAITWDSGDGVLVENVVETMNNMTVGEFYRGVADNPTLRIAYQTTGARLNSLIKEGGLLSQPGGGKWTGRPSEILPPSFQVKYVGDDEPATWYTGIYSPFFLQVIYAYSDPPMITLNRTLAELAINLPGEFYQVVQQLRGVLFEIEYWEQVSEELDAQPDPIAPVRSSLTEEKEYWEGKETIQGSSEQFFSGPYVLSPQTGEVVGARRFEKDYVVFKLSSFNTEGADILWKQMATEAKEAGVKKVIIDISGNGGGLIWSGYRLIMSVFPNVDVSWLLESWDVVFNDPMQVFYYQMLPLLLTFLDDILSMPESDLQATLDDVTVAEMQRLQVAAEAAFLLCSSVDLSDGTYDEMQCSTLQSLVREVYAFINNPGQNELLETLMASTLALLEYNPW